MRFRSLDLARGFTVLFIPAIHSFMLYSKTSVHTSAVALLLRAIAEGPGGQLFMLIMGIVFTFRKKHTLTATLKRSLVLLIAGYLLNVLKFVLPYLLHLLPTSVINELQVHDPVSATLDLLLINDILHFAAVALLILYVVHRFEYYPEWASLLAVIIVVMSPVVWESWPAHPPQTFFPLFPWLAYPLCGMTIGFYLQKNADRTFFYCGIAGIIFVCVGLVCDKIFPENNVYGFYRTFPAETLWHIGIVLVILYGWDVLDKHVAGNFLFDCFIYSSRHITSIYIIQWVLICWLLPLIGYQTLGTFASIEISTLTTMVTYVMSGCLDIITNSLNKEKKEI